MPSAVRVFISYSHEDADFVARLKSALESAGTNIWIDHERLTPGTPNWQLAIREGIERADAVIYVASPAAARSTYVIAELGIARDIGRRIIPMWADGRSWSDSAPMELATTQYIDARASRYTAAIAEILRTLGLEEGPASAPSASTPATALLTYVPASTAPTPASPPMHPASGIVAYTEPIPATTLTTSAPQPEFPASGQHRIAAERTTAGQERMPLGHSESTSSFPPPHGLPLWSAVDSHPAGRQLWRLDSIRGWWVLVLIMLIVWFGAFMSFVDGLPIVPFLPLPPLAVLGGLIVVLLIPMTFALQAIGEDYGWRERLSLAGVNLVALVIMLLMYQAYAQAPESPTWAYHILLASWGVAGLIDVWVWAEN